MKYIRTEDGRLLKVRLEYHELPLTENTIVYWTEIGEPFINKQNNFKLSNTIEELCDGYVVRRYVMDEPCHWFYSSKEQMKANISLRNKEYGIYGAIWVEGEHNEPILKPIAKMNDKGELELL